MGAHLNAYTSREQTVYYAKAFSKDLPRGTVQRGRRAECCSEVTLVCCHEDDEVGDEERKIHWIALQGIAYQIM